LRFEFITRSICERRSFALAIAVTAVMIWNSGANNPASVIGPVGWWSGRKKLNTVGELSGRWEYWYPSGDKRKAGVYERSEESGRWDEYHNNSKPQRSGEYREGMRKGQWVEWWYSGHKWREVEYQDGREQSPDIDYCEDLTGEWIVDFKARSAGCKVCRWSEEKALGLKLVKRARGYLRSELAGRLDLRVVPELAFVIDESAENYLKIEKLIREIHEEESGGEHDGPEGDPPSA